MKNKSIKIIIPSDLTPEQEAFEISKKLTGKLLSGSAKQVDRLRIGDEINVSFLNTYIEIERKVHNLIEFIPCPICETEFQNDLFFRVWTNYGGNKTAQVLFGGLPRNLYWITWKWKRGKNEKQIRTIHTLLTTKAIDLNTI